MRRSLGPLVVAIAAFAATVAHGSPLSRKGAASKSIGAVNKGFLEAGVHLETGPHVRVVGAYAGGDARWGVRELVEMIDRGAREVRKRYPDAVLGVGHISRKGGGDLDHHHSHESGRDADLAFYLVDVAGRAVQRERFVTIRPDGLAAAEPKVRFDDGRNWALVAALLSDPRARVTHIFVATHLRTRLLAYGARVGASPAMRGRVAEVLMQPHHALPHDDHFHVRVACPQSSGGCLEYPLVSQAKKGTTLAKAKPQKLPHAPFKKLVRARATGHVQIEQASTPPVTTVPGAIDFLPMSPKP